MYSFIQYFKNIWKFWIYLIKIILILIKTMNHIVNLIILILLIIVLLNVHNTLNCNKETFAQENKIKCNYNEDTKPFPSGNLPGSYLVNWIIF